MVRHAQTPHRVFQARLRQHALQIGRTGQQDLKEAPGFGIGGRHVDQIVEHGQVEFVGFVDDQDAGPRFLEPLLQPLDQGIHIRQRLTVGLVMKQLAAGFLDDVLDRHSRSGGDREDHRAVAFQMVEKFLKQGSLARPGFTIESHEPPTRKDSQDEAVERFLVLLRRIGKTRCRRNFERFFA